MITDSSVHEVRTPDGIEHDIDWMMNLLALIPDNRER
jgi:hypothetical protein